MRIFSLSAYLSSVDKMTLYKDETQENMNTDYRDRHWLLPRKTRINGEKIMKYTENGRYLSMETSGHSVDDLMRLDSGSLYPLVDGNYNEDVQTVLARLCEQLGSVEMSLDPQQTKESLNEIVDFDRIGTCNNTAADLDSPTIFTKDKDGDTLLHTAIILKETALIMAFIAKAPSYTKLSFKNLLFQTPLHLSVLTDQPEVTRRLIVAGTEVEARDKDGNTALHIACRQGQIRIVQHLLEPVRYHETKQNSYEIPYQPIPQNFSLMNYEGLTCIHLAAMNGNIAVIEALLDKDIDMNLKEGKTGRTVLHNACYTGDTSIVKLLLRHKGCNINARAFDESTPFDLARARGHDRVCMLLAAAGAWYGEENSDSE